MVKKTFRYTHVGRLPEDWDCVQTNEVINEISMGPFGSDITVSNFVSSGVPVLNGYNVSQIILIDKFQNFVTLKKAKLYNQGTMTFYAHENVENLGVYIFSCSFTRALICGKIIINDVVSVQPQKEIEMKTTDINKVRYTNRWRIVYGICNN